MTTPNLTTKDEPRSGEPDWDGVPNTCSCMDSDANCICGRTEQVVRLYAEGKGARPFSPAERAYLVASADHAAEGGLKTTDLEAMGDQDLAWETLNAWHDYVRSNCV